MKSDRHSSQLIIPSALIQKWIKQSSNASGYFGVGSFNDTDELTAEEIKKYDMGDYSVVKQWQLRIAVTPTKENLNKAQAALVDLFDSNQYKNIGFKMLSLNGDACYWDATQNDSLGEDSDRDQRGKEICIYMKYNPSHARFEQTPGQLKTLMLECWKALSKQGVEGIGYMFTPSGDKAVEVDPGLTTPFSYTAFKPFKGRHGILDQTNYNPSDLQDPLAGIVISVSDLNRYQLIQDAEQMLIDREKLLIAHWVAAKKTLQNKIKMIADSKPPQGLKDLLKNLIAPEVTSDSKIFENVINDIVDLIPGEEASTLRSPFIGELAMFLKKIKRNDFGDEQLPQLVALQKRINQYVQEMVPSLIDKIKFDFVKIEKQTAAIFGELDLQNLIERFPFKMQHFYRQCVHFIREEAAIAQLQKAAKKGRVKDQKDEPKSLIETVKQVNSELKGSQYLLKISEDAIEKNTFMRLVQHVKFLGVILESQKGKLDCWKDNMEIRAICDGYNDVIRLAVKSNPDFEVVIQSAKTGKSIAGSMMR